ncbi:MAG: hypothetical protein ACTS2F_28270 [Thainema sp.]
MMLAAVEQSAIYFTVQWDIPVQSLGKIGFVIGVRSQMASRSLH